MVCACGEFSEFGLSLYRHSFLYTLFTESPNDLAPVARSRPRRKTKPEESTCLTYTGLIGELEHLKIETRLIDEMFVSVMGEYVFLK